MATKTTAYQDVTSKTNYDDTNDIHNDKLHDDVHNSTAQHSDNVHSTSSKSEFSSGPVADISGPLNLSSSSSSSSSILIIVVIVLLILLLTGVLKKN